MRSWRRLATVAAALALVATAARAASAGGNDEPVHSTRMYGKRYCEVLLVHPGTGGIVADVYNTYTLNNCPAAPWAALDMKAVAQQEAVPIALRNGPRYWLMDSVVKERVAEPKTADFGGIEMARIASVSLGTTVDNTPYRTHGVDRRSTFTFAKGRTVHELVAPDDARYVMQTWSQQVDPTLAERDLAGLGSRLQLPEGWRYRSRVLRKPLRIVTRDAPAHVLQDDLMNSYSQMTPSSP
jgi:hypothetical protein